MKIRKKSIIRVIYAAAFIIIFSPSANASSNNKLAKLLYFFDMNEMAFAYHRHCLSTSGEISPAFLKTLDFVANELFAEAKKSSPGMRPEFLQAKILERRYKLQYRLDYENIENGCHTPATEIAKAHYKEFSNYKGQKISNN